MQHYDYLSILPKEIQFIILHELQMQSLGSMAQVNSYWNIVSSDDILWKPTNMRCILHRAFPTDMRWKDYIWEQHILINIVKNDDIINPKEHKEENVFGKIFRIMHVYNVNRNIINPIKSATTLKNLSKYESALAVLNLASEEDLQKTHIIELLGDLSYYTKQYDEAYRYYMIYYASIDDINRSNDTKLVDAVVNHKHKQASILVRAGAWIDQRDIKHGSTPLMFTVQAGNYKISRFLIECGANIYLKSNTSNYSVFDFAMQKINVDILELLLDKELDINTRNSKYDSTAIMYAVQQRNVDAVRLLIDRGADLTLRNNFNYSVMDFAMDKINVNIMQQLLDCGFDVNTRHIKHESTPLMFAAQQNNLDAVRMLISRGADISLYTVNDKHAMNFTTNSKIRQLLKYY